MPDPFRDIDTLKPPSAVFPSAVPLWRALVHQHVRRNRALTLQQASELALIDLMSGQYNGASQRRRLAPLPRMAQMRMGFAHEARCAQRGATGMRSGHTQKR